MIGAGLGKWVVARHVAFLDLSRPIDRISCRFSSTIPLCLDGWYCWECHGMIVVERLEHVDEIPNVKCPELVLKGQG